MVGVDALEAIPKPFSAGRVLVLTPSLVQVR